MNCREIQERLAEAGKAATGDPRVKEHLEKCPECQKVLAGLEAVDTALGDLPGVEPPKNVVERTLLAIDRRKPKTRSSLRLALAIASPVILVLVVGIFGVTFLTTGMEQFSPRAGTADGRPLQVAMPDVGDAHSGHAYWVGDRTEGESGVGRLTATSKPAGARIPGTLGGLDADPQPDEDGENRRGPPDEGGEHSRGQPNADFKSLTFETRNGRYAETDSTVSRTKGTEELTKEEDEESLRWKANELVRRGDIAKAEAYNQKLGKLEQKVEGLKDRVSRTKARLALLKENVMDGTEVAGRKPASGKPSSSSQVTTEIDKMDKDARELQRQLSVRDPVGFHEAQKLGKDIGKLKDEKKRLENEQGSEGWSGEDDGLLVIDDSGSVRAQTGQGTLKIETIPWADVYVDGRVVKEKELKEIKLPPGVHKVTLSRNGYLSVEKRVKIQSGKTTQIRTALEEVDLDRLAFIPAQGYFKNTYLPGDPELVFLKEKLEKGLFMDGEALRLERASLPYRQPFDAPSSSGLAVYLNADRAFVEGKSRVTLQVGLKGSLRHARRRASLNAALLVDLRRIPSEGDRRALWALADSMAQSLQAGDRFALVVAGVKKPLRVKPSRFDMTSVRGALASALQEIEASGVKGTLQDALKVAYQTVGGDADDVSKDTPIGANLVLLASAAQISRNVDDLQLRVHLRAVAGITLSTIGVGQHADMLDLGALALAGQGRRRMVAGAQVARPVVEEELSATGRVVARAVRLRIRLAKGVKLVEVLGSHPLTFERSERVRQMEQAIDKKVARNLGIKADRGEDEDGIQIVIPAYYAGDDHVILLDVVVPGPGKIADVRVRYKDLVSLKNAVARAELTLRAGRKPDDLLVRNVRKNLLAYRVSEDLQQAARSLEEGRITCARDVLARASARIEQMQVRYPELADDPEITRDAGMLAEYLQVLGDYPVWQGNRTVQVYLARSLAYAAKVKLPPGQSR